MTPTRPLVSFVILAYNQEDLIADSFAGAISQTYSPMEIILSDDCSPDGTFARMQELAANYRGPHRVRLNRNSENLHIGGHVQKVADLSNGDLIVVNAGDDISEPDRVQGLVAAWLSENRKPDLLHSNVSKIAIDGTPLGTIAKPASLMRSPVEPAALAMAGESVIGASQAWTKRLFDSFPALSSEITSEDLVLPFRAALLGGNHYVAKPFVRHRVGGISADFLSNSAHDALWGSGLKVRSWFCSSLEQMVRDIDARPDLDPDDTLRSTLTAQLARHQAPLDLAEVSWRARWAVAGRLLRNAEISRADRLRYSFMYLAPTLWSLQLGVKRRLGRL